MAKYRIAVLHLRLKQMAKKSNLEVVRRLARSVDGSAKILILPSLFNTGPIFEHYRGHRLARVLKNAAEKIPGPTSDLLSVLAVEKAMFILGGPIVERAGPRIFLTTLAYSPSGELLCKYRKIVVEEAEEALGVSPGKKPGLVELDVGYGIMAGSDVFYPEVARTLVLSGAAMLVAMLRMSRRYAEIVDLLRLRSIENNVPMIIVGGAAEIHGETEAVVPTMLYDERGRELLRIDDDYSRPVYIDVRTEWIARRPDASRNVVKSVETLCKALRAKKKPAC